MLSKAITWLKDWFGSSLLRRDTHRATDKPVLASDLIENPEPGLFEGVDGMWNGVLIRSKPVMITKAQRLAQIARKRTHLKEQLEQAKRQKRARKHLYAALEALTREELRIEAGK